MLKKHSYSAEDNSMFVNSVAQPSPSTNTQTPLRNTEVTNNTTTNSTSDSLSITSTRTAIAMKVITQHVEMSLEINNPVMHIKKSRHDDNHHHGSHADKLADKVIQKFHHEKSSHHKGIPEKARHAEAANTVRLQVARGFESATLALSKLGIMDNSVENDVAQTRAQLDTTINQVADTPVDSPKTEVPVSDVKRTTTNMVSTARSMSTALQITTKDGDTVTVNFSRSEIMIAGNAESEEGSVVYAGFSSSSQIGINIEGDLNKKESKSIEKIVNRVTKLAEKMFNGNVGDAMQKLGNLKINPKSLASMSLSMSSSIAYQAVSTYSETSRIPNDDAVTTQNAIQTSPGATTALAAGGIEDNSQADTTSPVEPAGQTAAQTVQETADVVNTTVEENALENPYQTIQNLFSQITNMIYSGQQNITESHKSFVSELFNSIVENVENQQNDNETDEDTPIDEIAA